MSDFTIQPTTAASFEVIDGAVTLVVHVIDPNARGAIGIKVHAFDVDVYALELANNLLAALVTQKDSEGVS